MRTSTALSPSSQPVGRPARRRAVRLVAVASLISGALAVAAPVAAYRPVTAPAGVAGSSATCPAAYPLSALHQGQRAVGYTTHHGTKPSTFKVTVLGVLPGGIVPGVDMILVRASSAAIHAAGGIWEGMSGSPIYASDGRLIGALSYGLTFGPSRTAGVTPAAAMYDVLGFSPARVAPAGHVPLTPALQDAVVRSGAASAVAAAHGLAPLATPVSVSAASRGQLSRFEETLTAAGAGPFTLYRGGTAAASTADPARIRPGAPIAVGISYGAFSAAGVGTVTAVCGDRVLAFGHPFMETARTTESAHVAKVLYVQKEKLGPSFVMADVGGLVGTIYQDRLVAVRGHLGSPHPATRMTIDARASTGLHQSATSFAPALEWVPDIVANVAYSAVYATLEQNGIGHARFSWIVSGHRANGDHWQFARTDSTSSPWGIGYSVGDSLYYPLYDLVQNPFEKVTVDRVSIQLHSWDGISDYSIRHVRVLQDGAYVTVTPDTVVTAVPGDPINLRVRVAPYRGVGVSHRVDLAVDVPADAPPGFGQVEVFGGGDYGSGPETEVAAAADGSEPGSFDDVLAQLHAVPRNDVLYAVLGLSDFDGNVSEVARDKTNLGQVVRGYLTVQVEVPGEEPPPEPTG